LRDEESRAGTFATTVVTMRFLVGKALLGMTGVAVEQRRAQEICAPRADLRDS
jgi:hypothetical protein